MSTVRGESADIFKLNKSLHALSFNSPVAARAVKMKEARVDVIVSFALQPVGAVLSHAEVFLPLWPPADAG